MLKALLTAKTSTILWSLVAVLVFSAGVLIGIPVGKLVSHSSNKAALQQQKVSYELQLAQHRETEKQIIANRDKWKAALESAEASAARNAKILEQNATTLAILTQKLKSANTKPIIIKELNNACKSSDIIVNTDTSDRLRNCLSSDNPAACSASGTP